MTFGEHIRKKREELRLPLRRFCVENGFDPSNVSKIERGILPPPTDPDMIARFARAIGLRPNTKEWTYLHDLAAVSAGRLPSDVAEDDALVAKLPILLRELHSKKSKEAQLEAIKKILRES
jgi:transcriptional regulator with XRE-family HTH domain